MNTTGGSARADRRTDPRLRAMAANALNFAIKERYDAASGVLSRMSAAYGGDGAVQAAMMWIDTLAAQLGVPEGDRRGVALMFKAVETGETSGADGQRPTVVWAGRLIAARFADDEATFVALINTAGQEDFGSYIGELLHMIALSLREGEVLSNADH